MFFSGAGGEGYVCEMNAFGSGMKGEWRQNEMLVVVENGIGEGEMPNKTT